MTTTTDVAPRATVTVRDRKVLFISYDGLTDPLGQSQILPYLMGLSKRGYAFHIISFEKPHRLRDFRAAVAADVRDHGIEWHPLPYTKRPPVLSTVWDVWRMTRLAMALHRTERFSLVHCRGYISMLAGMKLKRLAGLRLLFDMRGFWADEKVDAGAWRQSHPVYRLVYRFFKSREAAYLRESDGVVILTENGARELMRWPTRPRAELPLAIIPCSVDFAHFVLPAGVRHGVRAELGIDAAARVLVYLGSLGSWYMLEEMLDFFVEFQRDEPHAVALFLTIDDATLIRRAAAARGIDESRVIVRSAVRTDVPRLLSAADVAISFIRPTYSKISSSPTKMGEYFAAGLPVVTNGGVGDVRELVEAVNGGVVIDGFDAGSYRDAIRRLAQTPFDADATRRLAHERLDIGSACQHYAELYTLMGVDGGSVSGVPSPMAHD